MNIQEWTHYDDEKILKNYHMTAKYVFEKLAHDDEILSQNLALENGDKLLKMAHDNDEIDTWQLRNGSSKMFTWQRRNRYPKLSHDDEIDI